MVDHMRAGWRGWWERERGEGSGGDLNFADVSFFSLAFVQHPFSVETGLCGLWTKVNPAPGAAHSSNSLWSGLESERASERMSEQEIHVFEALQFKLLVNQRQKKSS